MENSRKTTQTMKALIITGSYPPDICGVGDYVSHIIGSKIAKLNEWELYYPTDGWSIFSFFSKIRDINRFGIDNIILESPTQGYGWSLLPHMLTLYFGIFTNKKFIVRIHEYCNLSLKARLASKIMLYCADRVIFTNIHDRNTASKKIKRLNKHSAVIPIFSNIPKANTINGFYNRDTDLIYFGHIRENKGVDEFLCIAKKLCDRIKPLNVVVCGQIPTGYEEYGVFVKTQCDRLGIRLVLNLDSHDVSNILNHSKIALLPFPDGATERRGSLLAALYNGCVVVSKKGDNTPDFMLDSLVFNETIDDFVKSIEMLIKDENLWMAKRKLGLETVQASMPGSWDSIVSRYIEEIGVLD